MAKLFEHNYVKEGIIISPRKAIAITKVFLKHGLTFIGNISKYKLLRKEKWPVLLLHLSWILIIIGAFVTRYISFEGMMPIREGNSEKVFIETKLFSPHIWMV